MGVEPVFKLCHKTSPVTRRNSRDAIDEAAPCRRFAEPGPSWMPRIVGFLAFHADGDGHGTTQEIRLQQSTSITCHRCQDLPQRKFADTAGIERMSTTIITEHPGWHETDRGEALRVVEHQGAVWLAHWRGDGLIIHSVGDAPGSAQADPPPVALTSSEDLPRDLEAAPLVGRLASLGTVARLTNPSLWDAITTALLRQVVRAGQAKKVYRDYCAAYGRTIETFAGSSALVPDADTVLSLTDRQFTAVGAAFNRTALRAAAEAYLGNGERWRTLEADRLTKDLIEVPRIGPWTAAAASADYTGDFSVYPHGDLAVRTWARKAAPASLELPSTEREFEGLWHRWAPDSHVLHALTLFTLTWGSHVRNAQHGGRHRT